MLLSLLVAQLLLAPPDCALSVGQTVRQGSGSLVVGDLTAHGVTRADYRMRRGDARVRAFITDAPLLASLTWRPPGGETATLTCTQRLQAFSPSRVRPPIVVCALDGRALRWAEGALRWTDGPRAWAASARGRELRVEVTSPEVGFVAAWREARYTSANAATLEAGGGSMTCWVH